MLQTLGTLWIRLDTPNVWGETAARARPSRSCTPKSPRSSGCLAVLGILIGAARLAWEQRADAGRDVVHGLLVLVLVTGCGVPIIGLLVSGADAWSQSIIDDATGGDFGRNVTLLLQLTGPSLAPFLVIFFGLIALVVSVIQIGLLVFRAAMLVLLAGLLPVAASMTTTQTGRQHFKKYAAWVLALVAYKPAAALIYAAAFRLIGTHQLDARGAGQVLLGLSLMTMAVVALPALLRFLVPAVSAITHGGVGAGVAGSAAAMTLPTGAKVLASRSMGGGAAARPRAPRARSRPPPRRPARPPALPRRRPPRWPWWPAARSPSRGPRRRRSTQQTP